MHTHVHTIEDDMALKTTDRTHHSRLNITTTSEFRSASRNWHGEHFHALALSGLEGGYTNGLHAIFWFYFGEAIQWTTDYPQRSERG